MYRKNSTRAISIPLSAMSKAVVKDTVSDATCDSSNNFVSKQTNRMRRFIRDDQFGVPLFSYDPDADLDLDLSVKELISELSPVDEDACLRTQVLKRQQLKRSLKYQYRANEKARMLKRRCMDELIDIVEEKSEKHHALHTKVVRKAREEARIVRQAQERARSAKRSRQHSRRLSVALEDDEAEEVFLFEQSSGIDGFKKALNTYRKIVSKRVPLAPRIKELVTIVFDCAAFLHLIITAKNSMQVLSASHLFARARDMGLLEECLVATVSGIAMGLFRSLKDKEEVVLREQTLSEDLRGIGQDFKMFLHANAVEAFKKLISLVVGLEIFQTKETAFKVYKWIPRVVTPYSSWPELIEIGLDSLASLVRVGELLYEGVPLSQAIFADDPLNATVKQAEELILKKNFTYNGLPIEGYYERTTFNRTVAVTLQSLKTYAAKMNSLQRKTIKLDEIMTKLTVIHLENQTFGRGRNRKAPMGIVLHGASSIGKSLLLKYNAKIHCDVVGREYSQDLIYQKNDEEYWNGYSPASNPYIQFPEVGCLHRNIAGKQGDVLAKMLLALVDTNPYNCSMADVDSKGKVYATPDLILIDTNIPGMNLDVCFNNPAAFARRFVYVHVTVKEAYCVAGSPSIDPAKVKAAGIRTLDAYNFHIYKKIPADIHCRTSTPVTIHKDLNIDQYTDIMKAIMAKHIIDQESFVTNDFLTGYGTPSDFDSVQTPLQLKKKLELDTPSRKKVSFAQSIKDGAEKYGLRIIGGVQSAIYKAEEKIFESGLGKLLDDLDDTELDIKPRNPCVDLIGKAMEVLNKAETDIDMIVNKMEDKVLVEIEYVRSLQSIHQPLALSKICETYHSIGQSKYAARVLKPFLNFKDGVRERCANMTLENLACIHDSFWRTEVLPQSPEVELTSVPDTINYFNLTASDTDFSDDEVVELGPNCSDCSWFGNTKLKYACSPGVPLGDKYWEEKDGCYIPRNFVATNARVINAISKKHEVRPLPPIVEIPQAHIIEQEPDLIVSIRLFFRWLFLWFRFKYLNLFKSFQEVRFTTHLVMFIAIILCFFRLSWLTLLVVVFHLMYLDFGGMIHRGFDKKVKSYFISEERIQKVEEDLKRAEVNLNSYHSGSSEWWIAAPALGALIMAIGAIVYIFKHGDDLFPVAQKSVELKPESSDFKVESELNAKLNELEDDFSTAKPADRIVIKNVPEIWNRVYSIKRCAFTGDSASLWNVVQRSIRRIRYVGSRTQSTLAFLVKSNVIVLSGHAIYPNEDGTFELWVSTTGDFDNDTVVKKTKLRFHDLVLLKDDLYVANLNQENSKDLTKHFAPDKKYWKSMQGVFGGKPVMVTYNAKPKLTVHTANPRFNTKKLPVSDVFYYNTDLAVEGNCVMPLILQKDSGSCIAGFHFAGNGILGASSVVTKDEIVQAIKKLHDQCGLMEQSSSVDIAILPDLVESPHPKSFMRYEILHGLEYWGSIPNYGSVNNKSQVERTKLNRDGSVDELLFNHFGYISTTEYGAPLMKEKRNPYVNPWNINLCNISNQKPALDRDVVIKVNEAYFNQAISHFQGRVIKPWDIEVAINGAINDGYIKRVDAAKSAGFGHAGVKADYLILTDGVTREPVERIKKELLDYLVYLEKGENPGAVFVAQLKDEPRAVEKIEAGKTRLFCVSEVVNLIAARMFLGPLFSLVMENNEAFRVALGVDMHRGGVKVFHDIHDFSEFMWEGDYSKYDQAIPFEISWACSTFFYKMAVHFGYSEKARNAVRALMTDTMFPVLIVNGDVVRPPGFNPSGVFDTVVINSIKNNLMKNYCLTMKTGDPTLIYKETRSYVLGDDTADAVSPSIKDVYNGVEYQKFCKEHFGMTFTPTDKNGVMSPFVNKEDLSFLKRRKAYNPILKRDVAVIDLDSCRKTLMWRIPSGILDPWNQMLQAAESVLTELFLHSKSMEQFVSVRSDLIRMIEKHYLVEKGFLDRYFKQPGELVRSLNIGLPDVEELDLTVSPLSEEEPLEVVLPPNSWSCTVKDFTVRRPLEDGREGIVWSISYDMRSWLMDSPKITKTIEWSGYARTLPQIVHQTADGLRWSICEYLKRSRSLVGARTSVSDRIVQLQSELALLEPISNPAPGISAARLSQLPAYTMDAHFRLAADMYVEYVSKIEELESTIKLLQEGTAMLFLQEQSQSYEVNTSAVETEMKLASNISSMTGQVPEVSSNESTFDMGQLPMDSWDNQEFMTRPVFLTSGTWTVGQKLEFYIEPWKLFLQNQAVRAKIRNQWLLSDAELVVRIQFSGTLFHQSRAQITYIPMALAHPIASRYLLSEGVGTFADFSRLVYFSQQKDVMYADPSDNQPYDLRCPLVKFQPCLRFKGDDNGTVLGALAEFPDFIGQGVYSVISLENLEAVSDTPTNVTYNIYAWMENVKMGVDTATKMVLNPQSEDVTGPVERTAMAAANIANQMSEVPIIGPYAKAGEMIFSGMGKLAAVNGFSRPTITTEPHRFKNEPFQNAANVIGSETTNKVTLDPKSELGLGNTIDAEAQDEMHFSYIYERESFIGTVDWTVNDAIMQPLYTVGVTPSLLPAELLSGPDPVVNNQPTPAGFLSEFFGNWRGTLCLRIDFVKTKFHTGLFGMLYEPNAFQHDAILAAGINLNVQKALIVDLNEVTRIELEIYWNQGSLYLPTFFRDLDSARNCYGANPSWSAALAKGLNGFLTMFPITTLQCPKNASVHALLFAHWKDLEFNAYTSDDDGLYSTMSWIPPQPLLLEEREVELKEQSQSSQTKYSMNKVVPTPSTLNVFEFGEKPCSWRTLLKRWEWLVNYDLTAAGANGNLNLIANIIPPPSILPVVPTYPSTTHMSNWSAYQRVRTAYLGQRGSHKYRFTQYPYISSGTAEVLTAGLAYLSDSADVGACYLASSYATICFQWSFNGFNMYIPDTQGGIEFQLPQYTNNLWSFASNENPYDTSVVKHIDPVCYRQFYVLAAQHYYNNEQPIFVYLYHCIGDDFTFMRFMGAPCFSTPST